MENKFPSKYKDLISLSQDQQEEAQLDFKVEGAKLQLDSDILATKQSIIQADQSLSTAKSSVPFQSQAILDASIKLRDLKDGLDELNKLKDELF